MRHHTFGADSGLNQRCEDQAIQPADAKVWGSKFGPNSRCLGAVGLRRRVFEALSSAPSESLLFDKAGGSGLDCFRMECRPTPDGSAQDVWVLLHANKAVGAM